VKRGYETPTPEEIEQTEIKCFRVFIPDHPHYRQAFLGAFHGFTTWGVWKKTTDQRAKLSADLWKEAMEMTMNECPDVDLTNIESSLAGMMTIQSSLVSVLAAIRECICRIATVQENPPAPYPEVPTPPTPEEPPIFSEEPPTNPEPVTDCQRNIWLARVVRGKLTRIAEIMSASFPLNWIGIFKELTRAEGQATMIYRFTMLIVSAFVGVAVLVFSLLGWGVGATFNAWADVFHDYIFSCKVYKNNASPSYSTFAAVVSSLSLSDLGKAFVKVLVWQEMLEDIFNNTVYDENGEPHTGLAHLMPDDCEECPTDNGWRGTTMSACAPLYWTIQSGDVHYYQNGQWCNYVGDNIPSGFTDGFTGSHSDPATGRSPDFTLSANGDYDFYYRAKSFFGAWFVTFSLIDVAADTSVWTGDIPTAEDGALLTFRVPVPLVADTVYRLTVMCHARIFECYDTSWENVP